MFNNSIRELNY